MPLVPRSWWRRPAGEPQGEVIEKILSHCGLAFGGGESHTGGFDRSIGDGSGSKNGSDNDPAELAYVDMNTFLPRSNGWQVGPSLRPRRLKGAAIFAGQLRANRTDFGTRGATSFDTSSYPRTEKLLFGLISRLRE